jgi:hypothetical protein
MAVFWVVAPCSLIEVYRRFRGACCLHQGDALMMEAASAARRNNPEDSHLHSRRHENLKSHLFDFSFPLCVNSNNCCLLKTKR